MMVGPENIATMAADMGITSPIGDNPSIALGGLETGVSPLEMANAYATLAAGGQRMNGTMLDDGTPAPISIKRSSTTRVTCCCATRWCARPCSRPGRRASRPRSCSR